MKKITFLVLFTLTFNVFSQIDSTKVAFVSYWSMGDSYDFKISKINKQWKKGELVKDQKQEYIANFTVIDSTETSYTINWTFENDLGSTYNIPDELLEKFSKYKLTEVIYKTSELGDLVEIVNWKEISELMGSMFQDVIDVLGKEDKSKKETLQKAMQPLLEVYSSKQGVEELLLKELQYFHYPMGLEYDITEAIVYEDEIPNMFGGAPIKADAKLYFEEVDFDDGFCVLKQEMKLNTDDTKKLLLQIFNKMNLKNDEIDEALKTAIFKIEDTNVYEYYYDPGIPHRIETLRETTIDIDKENAKRVDKIIIELIYNE